MSHGGADDRRAPCIALLGGSFDPVHAGHLALADAAHAHGAAEVVWVPVAQSPFKLDGPRIEDADRLALLQAALLGRSGESIELREWGRSGPSYTIETLRELTAEQPSTRWAWLMGEDCLKSFVDWREAAEIAALAELWVGPRLEGSSSQLELHASRVAEALPAVHIERIPFAPQHARSTEIRDRLAQGEDPGRGLLPASVLHEIVARGLYGWPRSSG